MTGVVRDLLTLRINGTNEITGIYIPREKKYCIFEEKLR
jgi:hypothetical protein